MRAYLTHLRFISQPLIIVAILIAPLVRVPSMPAEVVDPLADGPVEPNLFNTGPPANPFRRSAPRPRQPSRQNARRVYYQTNIPTPPPVPEVQTLPAPPGA